MARQKMNEDVAYACNTDTESGVNKSSLQMIYIVSLHSCKHIVS